MDPAPLVDSYEWSGGRETMLRFGPNSGPRVVVVLPLFEEANRTRAFAATICRKLAGLGVGSILPDLPGQGDSPRPLQNCSILHIADGVDGAIRADRDLGRPIYGVAIRSGALLDKLGLLHGRWHLAPQRGPDLLRELKRLKQATESSQFPPDDLWYVNGTLAPDVSHPPVDIAGNRISVDLLTAFSVYEPWTAADGGHVRTVRLTTDPGDADHKVDGPALWRRMEPGNSRRLAETLAADIAHWIAACEG